MEIEMLQHIINRLGAKLSYVLLVLITRSYNPKYQCCRAQSLSNNLKYGYENGYGVVKIIKKSSKHKNN